jgi:hypothetical protein
MGMHPTQGNLYHFTVIVWDETWLDAPKDKAAFGIATTKRGLKEINHEIWIIQTLKPGGAISREI